MGSSTTERGRAPRGRRRSPALLALGVLAALALPAWMLWALGADAGGAEHGDAGAEAGGASARVPSQIARAAVVGVSPSPVALRAADESFGANEDLTLQPMGPEAGVPLDAGSLAELQAQPGLDVQFSGQLQNGRGEPARGLQVYLLPGYGTAKFMGLKEVGVSALQGDLSWMDELAALADLPATTTDAGGRFDFTVFLPTAALTDDPAERGEVELPKPVINNRAAYVSLITAGGGFVPALQSCVIKEAGAHDGGTAVLRPGAELSGRLIDEQGQPLAGVALAVAPESDDWPCPARASHGTAFGCGGGPSTNVEWDYSSLENHLFWTRSGSDGRFTLSGLSPSDGGVLRAQRPGLLLGKWTHGPLVAGQRHDMGDLQLSSGEALAGTVVDEEGRPIPGATVRLAIQDFSVHDRPGGDERFTVHDRLYVVEDGRPQVGDQGPTMACSLAAEFLVTETDLQGRFRIDALDREAYGVFAVAPGFEPSALYDIPVGRQDLSLTLRPLGTVHIELVNEDGSPVLAESLRVNRVDPETPASARRREPATRGATVGSVTCDDAAQGLWTVQDLCDLPLQLTVVADGIQRRARLDGVAFGAAARTERVVLPALARLVGRTVDPAGQALAGVTVQVLEAYRSLGETESDDDGAFELSLDPGRDVRCRFRQQKADHWQLVSALSPGEVHDLGEVRFTGDESVRSVKVLVTDGQGDPLKSVRVGLYRDDEAAKRETWSTTSKDGWVTLWAKSPGPHLLRLLTAKPWDVLEEMPLTLVPGAPAEVVMVRPEVGAVHGVVRAGGLPLAWAKVAGLTSDGREIETKSDRDGRYELSLPFAADVTLVAVSPKGALTEPLTFSIARADRLQHDLTFGTAAVVGHVVDAVTGLPAPAVRVRLGHGDAQLSGSVVSDEAGQFRFGDVSPGTWALKTSSSRYAERVVEVALGRHDSVAEIIIELEPHGEVLGRVLNRYGDPLPGAYEVFLFAGSPVAGDLAVSTTSAQYSEFTLRPKDAGAYTVVITPDLSRGLREKDADGHWRWPWSSVSPFALSRSNLSMVRGESRRLDLVVVRPGD